MKRIIYPLLILWTALCWTASLLAQPVFNQGWAPKAGHVSNNRLAEVPANTGPGENQTWDFSDVVAAPSDSRFVFSYVDPATTPFVDSFPNATVAATVTTLGTFGNYSYYLEDASSYQTLGSANDDSFTKMTDTQKGFCYPLRYGDSFNDDYEYFIESSYFNSKTHATSFNEYDAYGTLLLPQGTFNDVARFVQYREEIDTLSIVAGINIITINLDTTVGWITPEFSSQLALYQRIRTITIENFAGQIDTTENTYDEFFTYDDIVMPGIPSSTQDLLDNSPQWEVYPNPAQDLVQVKSNFPDPRERRFTLLNTLGVTTQSFRSKELPTLDVTNLPAGMYWLKIETVADGRIEQTIPLRID